MARKIAIIQGHPDPADSHLGHALAERYQEGARAAGHEVSVVSVAALDFPLLRSQQDWQTGELPAGLREAQRVIGEADHLLIVFPLWLGDMPAVLKAFMEQVFRPGFAFSREGIGMGGRKPLAGKSARVVVTMGMPGFFYRMYFRAHSVKNLKRNILQFIGFRPVRVSLVGLVEGMSEKKRATWFRKMMEMGRGAV